MSTEEKLDLILRELAEVKAAQEMATKPTYTIEETAKLLGRSRSFVERRIAAKLIPRVPIGGAPLVPASFFRTLRDGKARL